MWRIIDRSHRLGARPELDIVDSNTGAGHKAGGEIVEK